MQTNIFNYVCFIVLCGLLVLDMVFFSSVVLQMLVCVLVLVCVGLVAYIAHKHHKGAYLTNDLQTDYSGLVSENVALSNELQSIKQKRMASKQDLQTIVTINTRLTHQIENLQIRLQQLSKDLQVAKEGKRVTVLPITPTTTEQTPKTLTKSKGGTSA